MASETTQSVQQSRAVGFGVVDAADAGAFDRYATQANQNTMGSIIELGLSLVDQGYSPQWATGGGVVNQISGVNVLAHALRRAKMPRVIDYNAGKSGDTITGALSRVEADIAGRIPLPGWVWYLNGGNDVNVVNNASDVETTLLAMKRDFNATWVKINALGMRMALQSLPDNGTWSQRRNEQAGTFATSYLRYHTYWRWNRYQMEFARRYLLKFANLAAGFSYPDRQLPKTCTGITVASNVATATVTGHGYTTGDSVTNSTAADATYIVLSPVAITVIDPNTFTYTFAHANGSAASGGSFVRGNTIAGLFSDSPNNIHFNPAGAMKGSNLTYEALKNDVMDTLVFSEGDACNLVGAGLASITDQDVINRGMMMGTGGTKTGTAVSHTGNVATGWNSDVVAGNPTAIVCSQVQRNEAGRVQMQDQQISIQASASNCEYRFRMAHALPTTWTAAASKSIGNWVMPTVANGYFYVAVKGSAVNTGATEPLWPRTPGSTVVDGSITWECRLGWINNSAEMYRLGAEYTIVSLSQADALLSMSFGLFDEVSSTNSILDGTHIQNTVGPGYIAGENGFFSTVPAVIPASMTAPNVALKVWVKANTTVVIKFGRASWYPTTLNI